MNVSELKKKLEGVPDDTEVAVGLPADGGVMPVPLGGTADIKDQDDNPWLLFLPATSCGGGCGGCGGDCEEAGEGDGAEDGAEDGGG